MSEADAVMTTAPIAMVRVTAARAFRRAGIGFAAGVNELDLLELTAAQILAIASEPALVMEGRLFGDDEWQVFPVPTDIDLPLLEAELEVAKGKVGEMRLALEAGRPDDDDDTAKADVDTSKVDAAPAADATDKADKTKADKPTK